jgi:hypothetical protein
MSLKLCGNLFLFFVLSLSILNSENSHGSESLAQKLDDSGLQNVHELLKNSVELDQCQLRSVLTWDGTSYGLYFEFSQFKDQEDEESKFFILKTSGHITSRVKIRNYFFSDQVKSIVIEYTDLSTTPVTEKDIFKVLFDKDNNVQKLEHLSYIGSAWNLVRHVQCSR